MKTCGDCPRWEKAIAPPYMPSVLWRTCPPSNQSPVWATSPECPLAIAERLLALLKAEHEAYKAYEGDTTPTVPGYEPSRDMGKMIAWQRAHAAAETALKGGYTSAG